MSSDDNQNQTALQLAKEQLAQANEALETTKKRLVALQRVIVPKSLEELREELSLIEEQLTELEIFATSYQQTLVARNYLNGQIADRIELMSSLDSADQELKRVCERVVAMEFIVKSLEPMNPEGHP